MADPLRRDNLSPTDDVLATTFGCSRESFNNLPSWKQRQLRSVAGRSLPPESAQTEEQLVMPVQEDAAGPPAEASRGKRQRKAPETFKVVRCLSFPQQGQP